MKTGRTLRVKVQQGLAAAWMVLGLAWTGPAVATALPVVQAHLPTLAQPATDNAATAEAVVSLASWFVQGQPSADAWIALRVLAEAATQGLRPQDYQSEALLQHFERSKQGGVTPELLAQHDQALTAALERYLSDLRYGRLSPSVLKHRFKVPQTERLDARRYIADARQAGRLGEALRQAQPQVPMYAALRDAMNAYRALGEPAAWQQDLPPMPRRALKPDESYAGLPLIAARLYVLGDLPQDLGSTEHYSADMVAAIQRFQARHGLESDGVIGPATLEQLKVKPAERVQQMALTLERLRWTPLQYGPRMIVVNVPEFTLRAYEMQGQQIQSYLEMRVVVGRALDTRTPIFLEDMRFIEFSPYWNIPPSIAKGETLPRLRRDPAYFDHQGFEFVTRKGEVITTLTEEALDAVQAGQWRIRQRPGPRNALGDIKFIFPNDQNIYLHHTPAPQLFARARRDFSHGCIRVEAPVELAEFVLSKQPTWTTERIQAAMEAGKSRTLRLDEPLPVLIAYSTAVVKDNGTVYFFPDIYQQDARLEQALRSNRPV